MLFYFVLLNNTVIEKMQKIGNSNIITYIIIVAVFITLYTLGLVCLKNFINVSLFRFKIVNQIFMITFCFIIVISIIISFKNEVLSFGTDSQNFIWHKTPFLFTPVS